MVVLDASAVVEFLLNTARGRLVADRIKDPNLALHVPHLVDVEVSQTLGRLVRDGELNSTSATGALEILQQLDLERHAHDTLLTRVWALRENLSAYDGVYVALAEALRAPLLTCDSRLARAPGTKCRFELVA
jgi:predicted nucleic acid-binding protein